MFTLGVALWLIYGWLDLRGAHVVANGLTLLLTLPLLAGDSRAGQAPLADPGCQHASRPPG